MQKFTGSIDIPSATWLMLLINLILRFIVPFLVTPNQEMSTRIACILFFLIAGGMGAGCLYRLLESLASYTVDEAGITRHAWNGRQEMRWSDVARVDVSGQSDSTLTLSDSGGRKLEIQRGFMSDTTVAELNSLIEPYLHSVVKYIHEDTNSRSTNLR